MTNKTILCKECGEEDIKCEHCKKEFKKGQIIICSENDKHYCSSNCSHADMDDSVIKTKALEEDE